MKRADTIDGGAGSRAVNGRSDEVDRCISYVCTHNLQHGGVTSVKNAAVRFVFTLE